MTLDRRLVEFAAELGLDGVLGSDPTDWAILTAVAEEAGLDAGRLPGRVQRAIVAAWEAGETGRDEVTDQSRPDFINSTQRRLRAFYGLS